MKELKEQIKDLDLQGLQDVLKEVKLYKSLKRQLGKRGEAMFHRAKQGTKLYAVEYFPKVGQDLAWEMSQEVYKSVFETSVKKDEVNFVENEKLVGGIKVYADDKMVDLSYGKIENQIK